MGTPPKLGWNRDKATSYWETGVMDFGQLQTASVTSLL